MQLEPENPLRLEWRRLDRGETTPSIMSGWFGELSSPYHNSPVDVNHCPDRIEHGWRNSPVGQYLLNSRHLSCPHRPIHPRPKLPGVNKDRSGQPKPPPHQPIIVDVLRPVPLHRDIRWDPSVLHEKTLPRTRDRFQPFREKKSLDFYQTTPSPLSGWFGFVKSKPENILRFESCRVAMWREVC